MLSFLVTNWRLVAIVVGVLLVVGFLAYCRSLIVSNSEMKREIRRLNTELIECKKLNSQLVEQIKVQDEKYQERVQKLLKLASKPVKVIEIPKVIEKPVYITNEECQKMGVMIDEFIRVQKDEKVSGN